MFALNIVATVISALLFLLLWFLVWEEKDKGIKGLILICMLLLAFLILTLSLNIAATA